MFVPPPPELGRKVLVPVGDDLEAHGRVIVVDEANEEAHVETPLFINGKNTFVVPFDQIKAA